MNVKRTVHKGYVWPFQDPEWSYHDSTVWRDFQVVAGSGAL